jgi:hypothetical protein
MVIAAAGLPMGALVGWTPPAGSDGDGADVGPGDVEDFAGAGEDHLAGRQDEPASVLLADVAGHFRRVPAGPHQLGCAGRSTLPSVMTGARHTLQ